ncbi:tetratricopeptide repeat-containing sensor histidine kinase [uncultured Tenacibaculum sp.]|uniref:tetratricopeptide repeat-containing sensor histidine kinase n=1 Tax=uncultured Tenacibaculum sp. TaxID=174713 RepID=UPI002613DCA2|nr:tetratricopeptide repeat-containing sensor histidine kinase [uncultured Tenacibaculum sp.]
MKKLKILILIIPILLFSQEKIKKLDEDIRNSVIQKGRQAYFSKDTVLLKEKTELLKTYYLKYNDSLSLAKYYHFKALKTKLEFKQDSTYYYYVKSKDISKLIKDSLAVGRRLLSMGNIQRKVKDYLGSELSLTEAILYLEPLKSYDYLSSVYNGLGIVNKEFNRFDKSIFYYNKTLLISELIDEEKIRLSKELYVYNNIGVTYQKKGLHKIAVHYFEEGLKRYKKINGNIKNNFSTHYALLLENLAYSNFSLGKEESVLEWYFEVISLNEKNNNLDLLSTNYINLSGYFFEKNDIQKSKKYAEKALYYAKISQNNKRHLEALFSLSELTKGEESKKYLYEYIKLNASLLAKERRITNQFAQIKFDRETKEKENKQLKFDIEKKQIEIEKIRQRNIIIILLSIISLLGLVFSLILFRIKKKKILLTEELKRIKIKEEERTRISKELHDGILAKLFGIRLGLGFFEVKKEETKKFEDLLFELQHIEKDIREVSHKLTIDVEDVDFSNLIKELIKKKSEIGKFNYVFQADPSVNWSEVSNEIKINIHRIIHELLNNIIKHASATKVDLNISQIEKESLEIIVKDNGKGFDVDSVIDGIGISNLKLRIDNLKGDLQINSKKGKGTKTQILIPLN